jgi:hypothetical protein
VNAAAFLLALGHRLKRVEGSTWRSFVFPASAAADAATFHADASVPVRTFVRRQRDARALLRHQS